MFHDESHHLFSTQSLRHVITAMRTNAIVCALVGVWVIADSLANSNDLHSLIIGFGAILMIPLVEHKVGTMLRSHKAGMYGAVAMCGLFIPLIFTMLGVLELVS